MTIPVYQSEFDDGLAEAIKSSASIAYTAEAKPYTPSASLIEKINSLACVGGQQDLNWLFGLKGF